MMAIKAIVFDMGGVLLRTEDFSVRERLAAAHHLSLQALSAGVFDSPTSRLAEEGKLTETAHWQTVFERWQIPPQEQAQFIQSFWGGDRLDAVLVDQIRQWRGRYSLGLLSNAWDGARASVEQRYHFLDAFDVTIFSAEVGMRKPSAEIFYYMLDQMKAAPDETVFVDDFLDNIRGAAAVGINTVHFRNRDQALDDLKAMLLTK
jgi:epoxide hydrolase-like predicted phosphatase